VHPWRQVLIRTWRKSISRMDENLLGLQLGKTSHRISAVHSWRVLPGERKAMIRHGRERATDLSEKRRVLPTPGRELWRGLRVQISREYFGKHLMLGAIF
jgi:hypothetical protein